MTMKTIAVDFDGTICFSRWPELGTPNAPLIQKLIELRESGACMLVLWTCREGELLENAVRWCAQQGLVFDAVNDNLPEAKAYWGNNSRKISYDLLIDDKSIQPKNLEFLDEFTRGRELAFGHQ